jgi:hypothetical protein
MTDEQTRAHHHRQAAAQKYQPNRIKLLLVGEAPPEDPSRYFYFEHGDDELFEHVARVLFETPPVGDDKTPYLKELKRRGVFLIDLKPDGPLGEAKHVELAEWLPLRVETLAPETIVLIGSAVYRAAHPVLEKRELPVVDQSVPYPAAGKEKPFAIDFTKALVKAGLERLIRPMPRKKPVEKPPEPA